MVNNELETKIVEWSKRFIKKINDYELIEIIDKKNLSKFNSFIEAVLIFRCPLCGGSKLPPNIPIYFIFLVFIKNYFLTTPLLVTIYL